MDKDKTLELKLSNVQKAYVNGPDSVKKALKELLPDYKDQLDPKLKDICDRIKDEKDVFEVLGENYEDFKKQYTHLSPRKYANELAEKITAAYNQGWWPTFKKGEKRWLPVFNTESGFVFSLSDYYPSGDYAGVGSALVFQEERLSNAAGKTFTHVYKELQTGKP